jgi:hypothetical protein
MGTDVPRVGRHGTFVAARSARSAREVGAVGARGPRARSARERRASCTELGRRSGLGAPNFRTFASAGRRTDQIK